MSMHRRHSPLERPVEIYVLNNPRRRHTEPRRPMLRAHGIAGVAGMTVLIAFVVLLFYGPRNMAHCFWIASGVLSFCTFVFLFFAFFAGVRIIPHRKGQGPTDDARFRLPIHPHIHIPHGVAGSGSAALGPLFILLLLLLLPAIVVIFGNSLVPVLERSAGTRGQIVQSLTLSLGYTLVYWGWVFLILIVVHFYF